jgi:hypothetical protein
VVQPNTGAPIRVCTLSQHAALLTDGVTSYMCYMYSGNNPVSYSDPSGYMILGPSLGDGLGDAMDGDDNIGPGPAPQSSSPETQSPSAPLAQQQSTPGPEPAPAPDFKCGPCAPANNDPYHLGDALIAVGLGAITDGAGDLLLGSFEGGGAADAVTIAHFTDDAGAAGITSSRTIRANSWVTLPSEISRGASQADIENVLEIAPGKGANAFLVTTRQSNLYVPSAGPLTSGGALQFQLKIPINIP